MTPEPAERENNLHYLDSDWKRATVYTAFLVPKTHQDAVRLIYGLEYDRNKRAPPIHHAQNWISKSRDELMELNLLTFTDHKLKNSLITARVDPIIQSLIEHNQEMMNDLSLREGVRLVLDSHWFRDFFSFHHIHYPMTYKSGTVYEPYRDLVKTMRADTSKKLEVRGFSNRIFQLLNEIGYYSHNIRYLITDLQNPDNLFHEDLNEDPILDDLLQVQNFDLFLRNHQNSLNPELIEVWRSCMEHSGIASIEQTYSNRLMSKIFEEYAGFFMPMQIAIALRSSPCTRSVQPVDCGYTGKKFIHQYRRLRHTTGRTVRGAPLL